MRRFLTGLLVATLIAAPQSAIMAQAKPNAAGETRFEKPIRLVIDKQAKATKASIDKLRKEARTAQAKASFAAIAQLSERERSQWLVNLPTRGSITPPVQNPGKCYVILVTITVFVLYVIGEKLVNGVLIPIFEKRKEEQQVEKEVCAD